MTRLTIQLRYVAAAVIALTLAACGGSGDEGSTPGSVVLKVTVSANGEITADGKTVTLEKLSEKMAALKKKNGTVLYHRENPKSGSHPNATKVVELVVKHDLTIRMSAKADFSDATADATPSQKDG